MIEYLILSLLTKDLKTFEKVALDWNNEIKKESQKTQVV